MSSKLTIKQAVELISVSESSLRRAIKSGRVSSEKDAQGRRLIDTSELIRVFGEFKPTNDTSEQSDELVNDNQMNTVDISKIVDLLEEQVQDLQAQISAERTEKQQLIDMFKMEQEKNKLLMLTTTKPKRTIADILNFFRIPSTSTHQSEEK